MAYGPGLRCERNWRDARGLDPVESLERRPTAGLDEGQDVGQAERAIDDQPAVGGDARRSRCDGGWMAIGILVVFAAVGSGVTLILVWRQLGHIAHAEAGHPEEFRRAF